MRLATIIEGGHASVAVVRDAGLLPLRLPGEGLVSIRSIAARGEEALARIAAWADAQPEHAHRSTDEVPLGPAVPDPRAIYTIGHNYRDPDDPAEQGPERPLVYGKAASSVVGHGATVRWDRAVTAKVDAECELGVVIGSETVAVSPAHAMDHVFGYTIINDVSSRDPWLDGDQWLIGKSMPGFCPVGPWIVTRDELAPDALRLGCTINGTAIQDGSTTQMRFSIPDLITYLSRHVKLSPGDLIATGTPARLAGPLGPERHLEPGDVVTTWIERVGELTVTIA